MSIGYATHISACFLLGLGRESDEKRPVKEMCSMEHLILFSLSLPLARLSLSLALSFSLSLSLSLSHCMCCGSFQFAASWNFWTDSHPCNIKHPKSCLSFSLFYCSAWRFVICLSLLRVGEGGTYSHPESGFILMLWVNVIYCLRQAILTYETVFHSFKFHKHYPTSTLICCMPSEWQVVLL